MPVHDSLPAVGQRSPSPGLATSPEDPRTLRKRRRMSYFHYGDRPDSIPEPRWDSVVHREPVSHGPFDIRAHLNLRLHLPGERSPDSLRVMSNLQIRSVRPPFDEPSLASAAIAALSRADAMGLLSQQITCLDNSAMQGLEQGMAEAGIGRTLLSTLHRQPCSDPAPLSALLNKISEALDQSPAPAHEWRTLQDILGLDLLARLLGISQSSARRYLSGNRNTPDTVAGRLHFLAFVVGDLAGAYNDVGVRRWFDRQRSRLNGDSPAQTLGKSWTPDGEGPRRVQELSRALRSSPAT